jgi:hypothetical protein
MTTPILAVIPDGYERTDGYVRAAPGLWPDVRFSFRPALAAERTGLSREHAGKDAAEQVRLTSEFLRGKLTRWDVVDGAGRPVPLTDANLRRLHPGLMDRLLSVVLGYECPDRDPRSRDAEAQAENARDLREAAERGVTPGDVREARDAKN